MSLFEPGPVKLTLLALPFNGWLASLPKEGTRLVYTAPNEALKIDNDKVELIRGGSVIKKMSFADPVITAFFTCFGDSSSSGEIQRALTVVLKEYAKVYYDNGSQHIISFPFVVKGAFPFEKGIIIQRDDLTSGETNDNIVEEDVESRFTNVHKYPKGINFYTLLDPLGELGLVASSSTSSFDPTESLLYFPPSAESTLCATFKAVDSTVTIYHVRYLSHSYKTNSPLDAAQRSSLRRRSSVNSGNLATPNTPKVVDAESSIQYTSKKRISSHLMLSMDRMASGAESISDSKGTSSSSFDSSKLRKDVILTKLHSFSQSRSQPLKVDSMKYEDQEALVFLNSTLQKLAVLIFETSTGQVGLPSQKTVFDFNALDYLALTKETGHTGTLLVLKQDSALTLVNPFLKLSSSSSHQYKAPIQRLVSGYADRFVYSTSEGKTYTANLLVVPTDTLVMTLLKSLKYAANDYVHEFVWLRWCSVVSSVPGCDDWTAFVSTMLSLLTPEEANFDEELLDVNLVTRCLLFARTASLECEPSRYPLQQLAPTLILAFHLIHEDLKLNILQDQSLTKLGVFLKQMTIWMGWSNNWRNHYVNNERFDTKTRFEVLPEPLQKPPQLLASLASLFTSHIVPYVSFSQVAEEDYSVDELITPRTFYVLRLLEIVVSADFGYDQVIKMMVEYGITAADLETYPAGIYFVLQNAISECQNEPPLDWLGDELRVIGRKDICRFASGNSFLITISNAEMGEQRSKKDVHQLLQSGPELESVLAWDNQAEADRLAVTKLIFSEDRRFYEITRLLQSSRVQVKNYVPSAEVSEHAHLMDIRRICAIIALRTLTAPIGRAALFFNSRRPLTTEKFPIPKMNFSCMIKPAGTTVTLDSNPLSGELMDWGHFHNGASSGMTVARDVADISEGWIVFNKPRSLNSQHAGFLLGLGLNGHLKSLQEWQIYNYLGAKHNHTSIGLLLGMSASLKGTMDTKLTKVLSVHIVALLPEGSTNLNVALPVQIAGLVGIGLLYLESQHRRITTVLLSQLVATTVTGEQELAFEAYRLAAGIALGFVNLGKGDLLKSGDSSIVDKLLSVGLSLKDIQTEQKLDKSAGGAMMALMFMFMKTENMAIAEKLGAPPTAQLLDYIRPDILLLRCLAQNMILWKSITPSLTWIFSHVPSYLSSEWDLESINTLDSDILAYLNILAGACMSLGVKYASSGNAQAKSVLLHVLDQMMRLSDLPGSTFDEITTISGVNNVRDIVLISCSLVMAATGDLDVFRRARVIHDQTDKDTGYAVFMSTNMALGFLFLGGGQQAFDVATSTGVAMLLTSIYPVFPRGSLQSVDVHLQALRHFWCLSVVPRCLVVRDVETDQPVQIAIEIVSTNGKTINLTAPCLLPDVDQIAQLRTISDGYFPTLLDFEANPRHKELFLKELAIYVYSKREYKDLKLPFQALLKEAEKEGVVLGLAPFKDLQVLQPLTPFEQSMVLQCGDEQPKLRELRGAESTVSDFKLELVRNVDPRTVDDLWNMKVIFNYTDRIMSEGGMFLNIKFIESLKTRLWHLTRGI
ncbi:unnamed protein product [Kuraishia capsulata CBS 1993]|uniref:Anaphase-promoting complex subunit 1 N-terminal domain-containing protein n=1 Tax=Kuraishia capsulata CBS 1993 TaxID=1382522 RepID=W6MF36_9ASCO|nr:uncharacterized protein KUCA_T00000164001 [Kuraishia capsulata CBS 1993]CDK24204.1 unnamed protein product [Kuraishia capsulata CBS 1993]